MTRRGLVLGAAAVALSWRAASQEVPKTARVGWLAHEDTMPRHFFDEALARLGWVEGKNLVIERRFGGTGGEQIASAAAELVAWHPDVIVAMGTIDARPVLALTRAIPIVVLTAADPVGQGLGASLARPGGSVTGTALGNSELVPKLLELAHDLIPSVGRVSVLGDPRNAGYVVPPAAVGELLGLTIKMRTARRPEELDAAFAAADGDGAIVVQLSPLTSGERLRVIGLAVRFRLPAVYPLRDYVEAGGLISYGPVLSDNFKRAAALVDKILRGASPGELPFEQPTRFELVVNLKTAKELGLTIPPAILARADEVIE